MRPNFFPKKLIVIGDSSVYGWGDLIGGGWCERLRISWMNLERSAVIYSLGIRGDGIEKLARRWKKEWECRGELNRKVPDGLLLSVGLNDTAKIGRKDGRPQLSEEGFKFGIKSLLKEIKGQTSVFVLGLTPVLEDKMPFAECLWYSNKSSLIYEKQLEASCLDLDIPFLPIYQKMTDIPNWKNFIKDDGIHLNEEGHKWLFTTLISWKALIKWREE